MYAWRKVINAPFKCFEDAEVFFGLSNFRYCLVPEGIGVIRLFPVFFSVPGFCRLGHVLRRVSRHWKLIFIPVWRLWVRWVCFFELILHKALMVVIVKTVWNYVKINVLKKIHTKQVTFTYSFNSILTKVYFRIREIRKVSGSLENL